MKIDFSLKFINNLFFSLKVIFTILAMKDYHINLISKSLFHMELNKDLID